MDFVYSWIHWIWNGVAWVLWPGKTKTTQDHLYQLEMAEILHERPIPECRGSSTKFSLPTALGLVLSSCKEWHSDCHGALAHAITHDDRHVLIYFDTELLPSIVSETLESLKLGFNVIRIHSSEDFQTTLQERMENLELLNLGKPYEKIFAEK